MAAVAACLGWGLAWTADKDTPPKTFPSFADSRARGSYPPLRDSIQFPPIPHKSNAVAPNGPLSECNSKRYGGGNWQGCSFRFVQDVGFRKLQSASFPCSSPTSPMAFGEVGKKPPENFLSKDPTSPRSTSPLPIGGRTAARLRRRFPPLLPQPRRDMSARFGEVGEVEKVGLKFSLLYILCAYKIRIHTPKS
jgi:hypothetical protein